MPSLQRLHHRDRKAQFSDEHTHRPISQAQLAREIGISASRMSRFLEENGICRFEKKQWAVRSEYEDWQIDVKYYWRNPKTQKWAFGTRKRWTCLGREKIIELWNARNAGQGTESSYEP